ncbi:ParB/RepB/Spo0J family partition protein [Variovorax boronicumulans]|nr:ParB/RepB/Spo0J family partition protein [Variovorax boronicumulans]
MPLTEFAAGSGTAIDSQVDAPVDQFMVLDLALIVASNTNPRTVFNLPRLEELATSIKASGVHQPVLVRPLPARRLQETFDGFRRGERPAYELIAGERRFRASKLAGVDTIPAMIRHLTDEQVLEIQLVENLQRDDLHPMEEAEGYEKLIQATHVTKEELGEKVGKSRGYVYGRLKLLALGQEARTAFYASEIDASRALVIARIPDAGQQVKALAEATAEDWQGGLRHNFKSFVRWAQQNMMLRLDAARFPTTDATLVVEAGSCRDCAKRTGAQPEVYADVESADVCTDPTCYHAKDAAHEVIVIDRARENGQQVILEKEAKAIWVAEHIPLKGYTRLDRPDPRVHETKMLKTVLGKSMPAPVLMQNPHKRGELIEVLPTSQVTKLLKESGKLKPAPRATGTAPASAAAKAAAEATRPVEERREYHNRWQAEAMRQADAHFKGWTGGIPASAIRAFLLETFDRMDEGPFGPALDLGEEFNTLDARNRLQTLPDSAMNEVFIRWVLHDSEGYPSPWTAEQRNRTEPKHPTWEILGLAGVDVDAIQAETKRAMESDDRAAELAKAQSDAKSQATGQSGKKSSTPPAAPKKRGGKPSAEEVQAQIAEQLQQLDQAPDGAEQEVAAEAAQEPSQAPDGAAEEVGAAPAAPAAPALQVGDRITVTDSKYTQFEEQGEITHVLAKSKVRVAFDKGPDAVLPAAAVQVTAKALWPLPTESTAPVKDAPATFSLGQLVKVKAGSKSAGGKALKTVGKVGRIAGLGDDGRVHLRHGPRSHELVVVQPEQLEPYSAALQVVIGSKVRIHPKGFLESRNKLAWREGTVDACTDDGWRVTISATAKDVELVVAFDTAELEVLA